MDPKFSCRNCKTKVRFFEGFKFNANHVTVYSQCDMNRVPKNIKSWNYGFIDGFISVITTAVLILSYYKDFPLAIMVGIITGALGIFSIALYTFLTTEFKDLD